MSQLKQAQCEELLYLLKKILPAATRMPHHGIFCKAGKKHDPAKDSPQCTCAHSAFAAIQRAEEILATPPVVQMGAYAITADDEPKRDCACGISGLSPADHLWDCPVRLHAEKGSEVNDSTCHLTEEDHHAAEGPREPGFRDVVIDALVVNFIYTKEHETNPRKALSDLIAWEVKIALDPRVSKDAAELQRVYANARLDAAAQRIRELGRFDFRLPNEAAEMAARAIEALKQ